MKDVLKKIETLRNDKESCRKEDLLDIITYLAKELYIIKEKNEQLEQYVDNIDNDLGKIESMIVEDYEDLEIEEFEEDSFKEITCNNCYENIYLDEEIFKEREEFTCPNCYKKIKLKK